MKHIYTYIAVFILTISVASAQSFRVISFEEDQSDLSAVKYSRSDVNDQKCAIIKVYTNLDGLFFETRLGIEGDIVAKTGEFWVYVSPREKQIKVIKNGFIPLEYAIPLNIEESKVYKLTLTGSTQSVIETPEAKTEFVVFETTPSEAQIFINDKLRGISPLTVPLTEGIYSVRIEKALYKAAEFDLDVKAGNTISVNKTLSELDIYGSINITTDKFADIFIDNKKTGTGNYSERIIEGVHIVEIRAENYKTFTKEILVVANRDYNLERNLEAKLGTISIQSSPMGASIFIDGEFAGTTPKFVREIKTGKRQITLEKEGYASSTRTIDVLYDKTAEYNFELNPGRLVTIKSEPGEADVYLNEVLLGTSPVSFNLDYTKNNKIKISKSGYHTVYDEIPQGSLLKEKTYRMEKQHKSVTVNKTIKIKNKDYLKERSILGWSLSGLNARPGGISSSVYVDFGNKSQYGAFFEGAYQVNNYNNYCIDGVVNFPRFDFGIQYNLWLRSFAVIELYGAMGREYAMGLKWKNYDMWDFPPDEVYTKFIKFGLRAGVRISPHAELFGAYNINLTDGPAYDIFNSQAEILGTRYYYQTIFPDRNSANWELGIRFVIY